MKKFSRTADGWMMQVPQAELVMLRQLVDEVMALLDAPVIAPALFSAIDPEGETSREEPQSPSLARLLPQMSRDFAEAGKLRALTEDDLRTDKSSRLEELSREFADPSGPDGAVLIPFDKEWLWLAGLNDLRLALSARLQVNSAADAEKVYLAAAYNQADTDSDIELITEFFKDPKSPDPYISSVYMTIAWWQESLLAGMEQEGDKQ